MKRGIFCFRETFHYATTLPYLCKPKRRFSHDVTAACTFMSVCRRLGLLIQWNDSCVGVANQSCGSWTIFCNYRGESIWDAAVLVIPRLPWPRRLILFALPLEKKKKKIRKKYKIKKRGKKEEEKEEKEFDGEWKVENSIRSKFFRNALNKTKSLLRPNQEFWGLSAFFFLSFRKEDGSELVSERVTDSGFKILHHYCCTLSF